MYKTPLDPRLPILCAYTYEIVLAKMYCKSEGVCLRLGFCMLLAF